MGVWSPVFKIKQWKVEGTNFTATMQAETVTKQFIESKMLKVIPRDSWFTFWGGQLTGQILSDYPEAASVQIERNIKQGIKIKIIGRETVAVWCQCGATIASATTTEKEKIVLPVSERCFFIDSGGLAFRESPEISGTLLPTFFRPVSVEPELGRVIMASSTIQFAVQARQQLRDAEVNFLGFILPVEEGSADLTALTDQGWAVYFDANRSLDAQAKVLSALLGGELKERRGSLKYVDLRTPTRVYYK